MDFLGKRVRITDEHIEFYLNESYFGFEHPNNNVIYSTYDRAIEACLLMGIFNDSFPGIITGKSPKTGNYLIHFDTGYAAFFPINDVIFQEN